MGREEFLEKREALYQQIEDLKHEYIVSNSAIPKGTKVKVHYGGYVNYGVVIGYEISSFWNDVLPIVVKLKKDGTASKIKIYIPSINSVKICD